MGGTGINVVRMFKKIVMLVGVLLVAGSFSWGVRILLAGGTYREGCLHCSPGEEAGIRILDGQKSHLLSRIVVLPGAHAVEDAAARELQHYHFVMTGSKVYDERNVCLSDVN